MRVDPRFESGAQALQENKFVDYYEVLQLSPNATAETVERVFRILAKRYHPDNQETGSALQFAELHKAYELLSNPMTRAAYDVKYEENRALTWKIFKQEDAGDARADDRRLFHGLLSVLYIERRRNPYTGGLGVVTLERMLGCPRENLEFPIWYLKQRGWIERLESGYLAISAAGIDKLGSDDLSLPANRLLEEKSMVRTGSVDGPLRLEGMTVS